MNRASNVCMHKEELSKYCIGDSIVITPTKALMIVGAIFLIGFVNPILEEFYWRLFAVEILKTGESDESSNNISGRKAQDSSKLVWLTSFAFGLHHFWMQCSVPQPFCCYLENGVPGGIGFIFVCMILGLVFHWQKNRGGMFNAWLVHFGLNIGQLFCMYLESVVNAEVAIL
ncbi:unnamed protein product [Moneuplotes crassus]|uniref:CAAX prenyl protease 2/Lysostaphin resistance protein A-like domain-containing protein n=1 Tax=Euplotes crassus TaxID=5936 RepID=A0AAD1XMT7_EUPCR|nr:unnamed protein product [Moneuplotes crassus]